MDALQAKEILEKYRNGKCTPEEAKLIEQWYRQLEETGDFEWLQDERQHYATMIHGSLLQKIRQEKEAKVVLIRRAWSRWLTAASIILVLGSASYFLFFNKTGRSAIEKSELAKGKDVPAPTETKAVITLADGRKVYLDSVKNGTVAQQENVNVIKTVDGKIIYSPDHQITPSQITYNTLSNPRGSKVIDVQLSDGSHVWLNAGSSVTYPVAFIGNERKVEITGEAYFEVAHNASKPFIVTKGETSVTVLGTHFNVNAYDDEEALKVTLLEGSVKVSLRNSTSSAVKIKPGEQAVVTHNTQLTIQSPQLDAVMAWKNGRFSYNGSDIKTIMKEVARWYDVNVIFADNVSEKFYADVPRNTNVSALLKMLETTKAVHFKIEGRKVTVMK